MFNSVLALFQYYHCNFQEYFSEIHWHDLFHQVTTTYKYMYNLLRYGALGMRSGRFIIIIKQDSMKF